MNRRLAAAIAYLEREYDISDRNWRIWVAVVALLHIVLNWPRALWMADAPASWLTPPEGLGRLAPAYWPGFPWILAVNAVALLSLLGTVVAKKYRIPAAIAFVSLVTLDYWEAESGRIRNSFYAFLAFVPIILAAKHKGLWRVGIGLCMGWAFLASAFFKTIRGWLDPQTHAVLAHVTDFDIGGQLAPPLGGWLIRNLPPWGWETFDWLTVGMEAAILPALFYPPALRIVFGSLCVFHVSVWMIQGFWFWYTIPFYALFVPWDRLSAFRREEHRVGPPGFEGH